MSVPVTCTHVQLWLREWYVLLMAVSGSHKPCSLSCDLLCSLDWVDRAVQS